MLTKSVRFRKCKRCGRYFIMKGNYDTNYCDRVAEGETRNCQELAAQENYKKKMADNAAILAAQMLALSDEVLGDKLEQFKASMAAEVELKDQKLQDAAL